MPPLTALDEEERMLKEMVTTITKSGANVLFCEKGIDDMVLHFLGKAGVLAVKSVSSSDMEKLSRATGGSVGASVKDLKKAFESSVDDYVEICKKAGKKIEKSYKGSFNVRISPEIHKRAKQIAVRKGISLNQFIQKAVEDEVIKESENV